MAKDKGQEFLDKLKEEVDAENAEEKLAEFLAESVAAVDQMKEQDG